MHCQVRCGRRSEVIQAHATKRSEDVFRQERDDKIAKEKADEAKLNEHGGFSRGRHNLKS